MTNGGHSSSRLRRGKNKYLKSFFSINHYTKILRINTHNTILNWNLSSEIITANKKKLTARKKFLPLKKKFNR